MPWHDWQFWVATAIALAALWPLYRTLRPAKRRPAKRTRLTVSADRSSIGRDT